MIENESVRFKHFGYNKLVRKVILNEGTNRTRILYAGLNPENSNTILIHKIIELTRGKYYLEETVISQEMKSVHRTMSSLNQEVFHKLVPGKEKLHQLKFNTNPQIIAATSYSRQLGESNKVFQNFIIKDLRNNKGLLSPFCDFYLRWKIRSYLKK
jgi:hypothetical protein